MRRRWWGLDGRQTVALFAVALAIGIGVAVLLGPGGGDDDPADPPAPSVVRRPLGSRGSADAVWVFGFETLRFSPSLRRAGQLPVRGFGDVVGARGSVVLFDAGTGRVGLIDARDNDLRMVARLAPGTSVDDAFVPTVAPTGSSLWVAPDPGVVVRIDATTGTATAMASVATDVAIRTGLAGDGVGDRVYAATETPAGVDVERIGDDAGVAGPVIVAGAVLDGLAVDTTTVWLRSGVTLYALDRDTLAVTRTVEVPAKRGSDELGGLVSADGALWMLADGGAHLLRYDPARQRFGRPVRLLDGRRGSVELPAALVSDGRRVVAMVQRSGDADLAARVVVHEPARDRTRAVDVPGRIAPGGLALSTGVRAPGPE